MKRSKSFRVVLCHLAGGVTSVFVAACGHPSLGASQFEKAAFVPAEGHREQDVGFFDDGSGNVGLRETSADCLKIACSLYYGKAWHRENYPHADNNAKLLLDDSDWHVTKTGDFKIKLSFAGEENVHSGLFDGNIIQVQKDGKTRELAIFPLETTAGLKASQGCISHDTDADNADECAIEVATGIYESWAFPDVDLTSAGAFLVLNRGDGSWDIADIAALAEASEITCLPGLVVDATGSWTGRGTRHLSSGLDIPMNDDTTAIQAYRQKIIETCFHS